jgi:hypothetical protein
LLLWLALLWLALLWLTLALSLWLSTLLCGLLLLLLHLLHIRFSGLFLLHLNELLWTHACFGGFLFDLLTLECLELWDCHTALLGFHRDHLLDLLWAEGLGTRGWTW